MTTIVFENATRRYENSAQPALKELNLCIDDGEFLVLVGPSGCGKSTTLRMLAGLEPVDSGRILLGKTDVTHVDPKERDVAMVFQNYALYPHMSVADNMGFALKCAGVAKSEIQERVIRTAQLLGIQDLLDRRPKSLSGGQKQRVAMGRAIVRNPQAFLMDEPLSNLDAQLRMQMRSQIAKLQHKLGITTLYVTHDQTEALTMGDRIAVLNRGVLQQVGSPREMYQRPANRFVAEFVGSPAMNLLPFAVRFDVCSGLLKLGEASILLPPKLAEIVGHQMAVEKRRGRGQGTGNGSGVATGSSEVLGGVAPEVVVGVRPEHLRIVSDWHSHSSQSESPSQLIGKATSASNSVGGQTLDSTNFPNAQMTSFAGNTFDSQVVIPLVVDLVEEMGADSYVHGRIPSSRRTSVSQTTSIDKQQKTEASLVRSAGTASANMAECETGEVSVIIRVRPDHGLRVGEKIVVTVPVEQVHLFTADEEGLRLT